MKHQDQLTQHLSFQRVAKSHSQIHKFFQWQTKQTRMLMPAIHFNRIFRYLGVSSTAQSAFIYAKPNMVSFMQGTSKLLLPRQKLPGITPSGLCRGRASGIKPCQIKHVEQPAVVTREQLKVILKSPIQFSHFSVKPSRGWLVNLVQGTSKRDDCVTLSSLFHVYKYYLVFFRVY